MDGTKDTEVPRTIYESEIEALPLRAQHLVRAHLRAAGLRIVASPPPERADVA